jgi:hypothetical protein
MSESEFEKTTENYSNHIQVYSGLYNTVDMTGTLLNSAVAKAQLDQNARKYQWDAARYTTEKASFDARMQNETEIFLSFYTPERKHDDLHKNQTLWKIFLDTNNKRLEGKVKKVKLLTQEIRSLYPYHTTFATAYSITFAIPTRLVELSSSKLTVTGPVGTASLDFRSLGESQ